MAIVVEVDNGSGFCFGVTNAIKKAEALLTPGESLYCLGEIVHNSEEVNRLESKGLKTVDYSNMSSLKGKQLLVRAHGEPPETYRLAAESGIKIVDATCPIVTKLQQRVASAYAEMQQVGGQVVIFGKKSHPEVVGLSGNANGAAIIIEKVDAVATLDCSKPTVLFSQTTMDGEDYIALGEAIKQKMDKLNPNGSSRLKVVNSVCGSVSNRKPKLAEFSRLHDMVVFVAGKKSSNGKVLFEVCKEANPRTIFVESEAELDGTLFESVKTVGVCGATSTPLWLMEKVAEKIRTIAGSQA